MKTIKRIISVLLVTLTIVSCFSMQASAFSKVSEIKGSSPKYGQKNQYFYVHTDNAKKSYTLTMKQTTKGVFYCNTFGCQKKLYGYYEILVYTKDSGGKFTKLVGTKKNIKNVESATITIPAGATEYMVKVWSWNTSTIAAQQETTFSAAFDGNSYWTTCPAFKITAPWGCKLSNVA